jgi:hypothetical protein
MATEKHNCGLCGNIYVGFGNNPDPIECDRVCDECNGLKVIPARMKIVQANRIIKDVIDSRRSNEDLSREVKERIRAEYTRQQNQRNEQMTDAVISMAMNHSALEARLRLKMKYLKKMVKKI